MTNDEYMLKLIEGIDRLEKKIMKISEVMASFLDAETLVEEKIAELEKKLGERLIATIDDPRIEKLENQLRDVKLSNTAKMINQNKIIADYTLLKERINELEKLEVDSKSCRNCKNRKYGTNVGSPCSNCSNLSRWELKDSEKCICMEKGISSWGECPVHPNQPIRKEPTEDPLVHKTECPFCQATFFCEIEGLKADLEWLINGIYEFLKGKPYKDWSQHRLRQLKEKYLEEK